MLTPLLFGVPVALGIVVSVVRLLGLRYPNLLWATTVNSDAEELYLGHALYQSPAHGYTGQIYTPLFPQIVSLFDRIYLWNGWPLLLVIGASVSLSCLVARIAYSRDGQAPRVASLLGVAGIGGLAYWCVSGIGLPVLDEARADQVAWAFALFGLIAVADFGPTPSRRRLVLAALLLTAALWTKQTTIGVVLPVVAWVLVLAALSALDRRAALTFVVVLGGVNLALLGLINLFSHGWEFFINFELATHQANEFTYGENVIKGVQSCALAAGFVVVTWAGSAAWLAGRWRRAAHTRERAATGALRRLLVARDPTGRRALLLGGYAVFGFALACYFMLKQGTETNQMIGVVWALCLLAAIGWRVAQRRIRGSMVAGGCVALFFVLLQLGPVDEVAAQNSINIRTLENAVQWGSMPPDLLAYARHHTIYSAYYSDLNVPEGGPLYPNYYNFADLLAGGTQPMYLVHALLDRRFEAASLFPLQGESYASGSGKWEENYLWKLDQVVLARYRESVQLPEGLLERRPGPEQDAWMRDCFGPFEAGGASFRIHRGGGFWCSFSANHLELVSTPAPLSEVVTTQPVHVAGAISVSLEDKAGAQLELELEGGGHSKWSTRVMAVASGSPDLRVSTYLGGTLVGSTAVAATAAAGGRRALELDLAPTSAAPGPPIAGAAGRATLTVPASKALFALVARSGAAIDLHATRLAQ
jgi:hypothetical protein